LKNHLEVKVQDEISNSIGDYGMMWQRLDHKYGNVGRLIDTILYEIKNLATSYETTEGVLNMINIVEKAARDLDRLNLRHELYNATTISIVEQAMSSQMKQEWVRVISIDSYDSKSKFEILIRFIGDWKLRLEYLEANIRGSYGSNHTSPLECSGNNMDRCGESFHTAKAVTENKPERKTGSRSNQGQVRCWVHNVDGYPLDVLESTILKNVEENLNVFLLDVVATIIDYYILGMELSIMCTNRQAMEFFQFNHYD